MSYLWAGMGADVLSNAVLASPSISSANITKGGVDGNYAIGDSYLVEVMNAAQGVPVTMNGTVMGTTSTPDGVFDYRGVLQSLASQAWSVPGGPMGYNLGNAAPISRTINFGGPAAGSPVSPGFNPLTSIETAIQGAGVPSNMVVPLLIGAAVVALMVLKKGTL